MLIRLHNIRKNNYILILLGAIILYLIVVLCYNSDFSIFNITIYTYSILIFIWSIADISKRGLRLYNVFSITYFGVLAINNFNLSLLQKTKTLVDMYFFLIGPSIFLIVLLALENVNFKIKKKLCLKLPTTYLCDLLLLGLIVCKMYILNQTGIRLVSNEWLSMYSSKYVIPTWSGLSYVLSWLCLLVLPIAGKKTKFFIIVFTLAFPILDAKRGDIVRIIIYLLALWGINHQNWLSEKKNMLKIVAVGVVFAVGFSLMGNYRQEMRGGNFNITKSLQSSVDNEAFNWIYAYSALNFDVLAQDFDREPTGELMTFIMPIERVISGSEAINNYEKRMYSHGLSGFNATTFLGGMVIETNWLYFIEVFFLALLVGVMDKICQSLKFVGGRGFLLMLTVLTIFGNYYLIPSYLYSLICGMILYSVFSINTVGKAS